MSIPRIPVTVHPILRTLATIVAGLVMLAVAAAGARPLMTILSGTQRVLATSRSILDETRLLQVEVESVHTNLAQLGQQDELLAEQEALTQRLIASLNRQEELVADATHLLESILTAERSTVQLTVKADKAAAQSMITVTQNAAELGRLAKATDRIRTDSIALDNQVGLLLVELENSAENFTVVGRAKTAAGQVTERTADWWMRIWEWFKW